MTAARHLIIAHAAPPPSADAQLPPALDRVLACCVPDAGYPGDPWSLTPPHEHALATALGWTVVDGTLPWAAWYAGRPGVACAWLHPCHWQPSLDHVQIVPPAALAIGTDEAAALAAALAPLAAEDGLTLFVEKPQRWRLEGSALAHWRGASLDRVAHQRADPWWRVQRATGAANTAVRTLLRLLNEAQMLFASHPINDARAQRGLPAINGLWLDGAGVWNGFGPPPDEADVALIDLRDHGAQGDARTWRAAWEQLLREVLAPWASAALPALRPAPTPAAATLTPAQVPAASDAGPRWLTLCGERGWRRWCLEAPQLAVLAAPLQPPASDAASASADTTQRREPPVDPIPRSPWWRRVWPWARGTATAADGPVSVAAPSRPHHTQAAAARNAGGLRPASPWWSDL